jgi:hypothetical protein
MPNPSPFVHMARNMIARPASSTLNEAGQEMQDIAVLGSLFGVAFIAATILPAQSEAALVALLVTGKWSPLLLVAVASVGNVLGAVVNWALGRGITRFRHRRWFPVGERALERATGWYRPPACSGSLSGASCCSSPSPRRAAIWCSPQSRWAFCNARPSEVARLSRTGYKR